MAENEIICLISFWLDIFGFIHKVKKLKINTYEFIPENKDFTKLIVKFDYENMKSLDSDYEFECQIELIANEEVYELQSSKYNSECSSFTLLGCRFGLDKVIKNHVVTFLSKFTSLDLNFTLLNYNKLDFVILQNIIKEITDETLTLYDVAKDYCNMIPLMPGNKDLNWVKAIKFIDDVKNEYKIKNKK